MCRIVYRGSKERNGMVENRSLRLKGVMKTDRFAPYVAERMTGTKVWRDKILDKKSRDSVQKYVFQRFFFSLALLAHPGPRPLIQFRNHFSQTVGLLGRVIARRKPATETQGNTNTD
jgi:hypothetical protein